MKIITIAFLFQFLISCWPKSNIIKQQSETAIQSSQNNSGRKLHLNESELISE